MEYAPLSRPRIQSAEPVYSPSPQFKKIRQNKLVKTNLSTLRRYETTAFEIYRPEVSHVCAEGDSGVPTQTSNNKPAVNAPKHIASHRLDSPISTATQ